MQKILALTVSCLLLLSITACGSEKATVKTKQKSDLASSDFDSSLKAKDGFFTVAENDELILEVNGKTTEFCVTNKKSGAKWFSNPEDREGDTLAQGEGKSLLNSQLMITYIDSGDKSLYFNNYDDSILQGQYAFTKIDNGIRVIYDIGEVKKEYVVPNVISKSRFESLIAEKLSDDELFEIIPFYVLQSKNDFSEENYEEVKKKYPTIEKNDIYTLSEGLPEYVLEDMEKIILSAGYTKEDKAQDDRENMFKSEDKGVFFQIPVEYVIENGDFIARVITDEIVYSEEIFLNELMFLPSFGGVNSKEEGYLFVPDGSGAIINCNNGKSNYAQYKQPVYGNDVANLDPEKAPDNNQQINLPVFGIRNGNNSFIAIIEDGSAASNINAQVSGYSNSYNLCYSSFTVRPKSTITLTYKKDKGLYVYSAKDLADNIQIRYCFLEGDNASYNGMANTYREYLENNNMLPQNEIEDDIAFELELIGSVGYDTLFLGVPVAGNKVLTSYKQAEKIIKQLKDGGIKNINLKYSYNTNGGQYTNVPNGINLISDIGSKKELSALSRSVSRLFIPVELQRVYNDKSFDSYRKNRDSARSFSTDVALYPDYDPATLTEWESSFLIAPRLYQKYAKKVVKDLGKYRGAGVNLNDFGKTLYTDNNKKNPYDREQTKDAVAETLGGVLKETDISLNYTNDYALVYADTVSGIPASSSGYYLFDYDIPFYQMVIRGTVDCSLEPMNLADDYTEALLNAAVTGMSFNYRWIYEENYKIKDTWAAFHSLNYSAWIERAIKDYKEYNQVFGELQGKKITAVNYVAPLLTETVYENGKRVYVNFSDNEKTFKGITVQARSYICS
ncbi:MAG: hypothetical protein IKK24_01540 [Clostridia bacterium]|nr:hypothetical protein [Clostridia bacterium]